uniref:Uncharacterized protein n=1 Tax=Ixodes ricinus TaxID=34613 RepID=A0A6B0UPD8_IXORI
MSTTVTDIVRTAGHLIKTPGIQHALIAFHRAFTPLARSRGTRHESMIEGRKVAPETGQLKLLPVFLNLLVNLLPHNFYFFFFLLEIGLRVVLTSGAARCLGAVCGQTDTHTNKYPNRLFFICL